MAHFPKLRIEHLTLILPPRGRHVFAVVGKNGSQIGQRHVATMLVDELVDPQPAASCAVATPHFEHMETSANVVE